MDIAAHRAIKRARDSLVDGLQLYALVSPSASDEERARAVGHGLTAAQFRAAATIAADLYDLMADDPRPPECTWCSTPIDQPATGRPRLFCSTACRVQEHRSRLALAEWEDHEVWRAGEPRGVTTDG